MEVGSPGDFAVAAAPEPAPETITLPVRQWKRRFVALLVLADVSAALVAAVISWVARDHTHLRTLTALDWHIEYRTLALVSVPVWIASMASFGAYQLRQVGEGQREYRLPIVTGLRLLAAVAIGAFALRAGMSRALVVIYFPTLVGSALILRFAALQLLAAGRRQGRAVRRLVVVGDRASVVSFTDHLARHGAHGYRVVGCALPDGGRQPVLTRAGEIPVVGAPDTLLAAAGALGAEAVAVIGHSRFEQATLQQVAWQLERSGVDLLVAPDVVDLAGPRIRVTPVTGLPLLHIGEPRIRGRSQLLKAFYERAVALPLLLVTAPLMAVIALVIRLDSRGPIFYRQERIGLNAKPFTMLKFRTMVPDADVQLEGLLEHNEHDGVLFKIRNDPRVTRVGHRLRRYSLDELPQLINVVKGDMLLIGPRPCLDREVAAFGPAAHRRFMTRPGLTGLWQVSGRSDLPYEDAVRLDLYYVENWSITMDLVIVYRTVRVLLSGTGGY